MAIPDPISKAHGVNTSLQAARLMARLEQEISYDLTASEEWHAMADKAIDDLRRRFPGARALDAYQAPPVLSRAAAAGMRSADSPAAPARDRTHSAVRHAVEAAAMAAVTVATIRWLFRHARRHPWHAVAVGVVLAATVMGQPAMISTAAVFAAMVVIWRRRPRARPRPPRMTVRVVPHRMPNLPRLRRP